MGKEKKIKSMLLLVVDTLIIILSYLLSFFIRFDTNIPKGYQNAFFVFLPFIVFIYLVSLSLFKMYKSIWKIAGIDEVVYGFLACFISTTINFIVMTLIPDRIPYIVIILAGFFITIGVVALRISFRIYRRMAIYGELLIRSNKNEELESVLIVGAGACGHLILDEIRDKPNNKQKIVGFIDDNLNKVGTYLSGVKVLGDRSKIEEISELYNIDLILIAMPSVSAEEKKKIIDICQATKRKIKIIPGMYELIDGKVSLSKMRDVDLRDLLGREQVELDKNEIKKYIEDKIILVTGGGGSIGSELCRQISRFSPKLLLILDIYENNAYELENELKRKFPELNMKVLIASVRDEKRINNIFSIYNPQVVFHAAAHKHVPLMEDSPGEAIKNNVLGTLNVAECSRRHGVERFVLISTDKAVNPTNVMGASKRLCEMIVQAINKECSTEFAAVRFGNVLGSNGSVIPLFKKQIAEGGPITLTHKEITRYFMLIPEAAQLVLQAGVYANGGEIFVLDMGKPVKIYDLASELIKLSGFEPNVDIDIKVTGLRPGEKLYEELLMDEEGLKETRHKKIFIGKPGEYDLDRLKLGITALLDISKLGDDEMLKTALQFIVKTYKRDEDIKKENTLDEVAYTDSIVS
ncbi:polysaccharide biosynthesis protein [Clostridium sp. B9]|uniref:polysaccharide biosynthesis protein n=1 Tax=Clostridium sp. B9 TaxID=3423224 RepID=UPI003D2F02D4